MLHALREYGTKLGGEPGFKSREVRWCIQLADNGALLNVIPLGDGKAGANLERCPDMHAMNSGGKAHFLVESAQTIALLFKPDEDHKKIVSGTERHRFFVRLLADAARRVSVLSLAVRLLENEQTREQLRLLMVEKRVKSADWVTWQLARYDPLQSEDVQEWWRTRRRHDLQEDTSDTTAAPSENMVCLLTGDLVEPLLTQPKISGLSGVGGLAMGDVLVGFDKAAFQSFGLEKSSNAAMGAVAA